MNVCVDQKCLKGRCPGVVTSLPTVLIPAEISRCLISGFIFGYLFLNFFPARMSFIKSIRHINIVYIS